MTLHWPHALWLLLLPAGLLVAELARRVRATAVRHPKILRAEASPRGLTLLPGGTAAAAMPRVRWRLWLGLLLAGLAGARPQWGEIEEPVFEQAREILIAVDLSRSMLAADVSPSRLERAKLLITALLERLEGERVGLAVFAGTAFLQSPLSADYEILREFLPALGPEFLPEGGTEYAALLDTALDAFGRDSTADRFLIVLSDGESQTEEWRKRIGAVRERGVRVLSLGIGTAEGAMVPDGRGGLVKDERGAVVLSRLNHSTLEELARQTGGAYRDASSWVDLADLLRQTVEAGRQGEFSETRRARRVERFQWALAPALLLLLWSFWREFPVQPRARTVTIKTLQPVRSLALLLLAAFATAWSAPRASAVERQPLPAPSPASRPASGGPVASAPAGDAFEAPLTTLIGRLAGQPAVSAPEYAELANQTLTYGQRVKESGQQPRPGAVHDALAGVDAGEALDPAAADWPALRRALKQLLDEPPPEPESDEKQEEQDKDQDQNQDQKDQKPSDDSSSGKDQDGEPSDGEGNSESESGQPKDAPAKDEPGDPSDPSEGSEPKDSDQKPDPSQAESAFGDLDPPDPAPPSTPPPPAPRDPGSQKVGGQQTQSTEARENPALALPLQKLDQLKQQDSPAELFQLLQDPNTQPPKTGRDW